MVFHHPPWPADFKVPRWARHRRGRLREPDIYAKLQLDNLDRDHICLFRTSGIFPHVVEIIEHPDSGDGRLAQERVSRHVTITAVLWPRDPLAVFNKAVAKYDSLSRHFGDHRN